MSELESKFAESESKKARLKDQVSVASVGREESKEREQLLKSFEEKNQLKRKLAAELEKYKSCDPERLKELSKHIIHNVAALLLPTTFLGVWYHLKVHIV